MRKMQKNPFKEKTLEGSELTLNGVKNQVILIQGIMNIKEGAIEVDLGVMVEGLGVMNAEGHPIEGGGAIAANQAKVQGEVDEEMHQALRVKK